MELLDKLNPKELLPLMGFSRNRYRFPVNLPEYRFFPNSPSHVGPFVHAVDIAVPNPEKERTIVYAPIDGIVIRAVLTNTIWGNSPEYKNKLNYITIESSGYGREFVEIAHITPLLDDNNIPLIVNPGDNVVTGQPIGQVALNGWITTDNYGQPDSHIHMLVGQWTDIKRRDFKGLRIRWK